MTTALATAPAAGNQLAWCQPQTADEAWNLAQTIASTNLAPKDFKTPEAIFIVMQHGAELGLNAMQALQNIALVNNRPAVWGTLVQALVQRSGLVKRRMQGCLEMVTVRAIAEGKWPGRTESNAAMVDALAVRLRDRLEDLKERNVKLPPNYLCGYGVFMIGEDVHVQIFDSAHAQTAGLLAKQGPWQQYPERMHQHRAVTYLSRDCCGAALTGLAGQATVEELMDMPDAVETTASEVKPSASTSARMQEMSTTPAGAKPAGPAQGDDAKAAAHARLTQAINRLRTMPWTDGEPMSEDTRKSFISEAMIRMFGTVKTAGQMSIEDRHALATYLETASPPTVIDASSNESEPAPDEKTNF